jgi:hypothetical protein
MLRWMRSGSTSWLLAAATLGVCLAQSGDPGLGGAARAMTLTGQVSILKDSGPWALTEGDVVQPKQIVITGADGFAVFKVSDGSTFEVFPNSKVIFRDNADWKDLLDMFIGRVKVHIQKWGGQPNPNRVRTPTAVISVRGTTFDVQVEDEDATTLVAVEEGQVAVQHTLLPRGDPKLLNSGEWIRVYKNQPLAQKSVDKESIMRSALRAMADAIYTSIYRTPRTGGGGTSVPAGGGGAPGGGGLPGDTGPKNPPPAPPTTTPTGNTGSTGTPAPPPPPPPGT